MIMMIFLIKKKWVTKILNIFLYINIQIDCLFLCHRLFQYPLQFHYVDADLLSIR